MTMITFGLSWLKTVPANSSTETKAKNFLIVNLKALVPSPADEFFPNRCSILLTFAHTRDCGSAQRVAKLRTRPLEASFFVKFYRPRQGNLGPDYNDYACFGP